MSNQLNITENVVIEMAVNIGYGKKLIRSAYNPDKRRLHEAAQPIHDSSEHLFGALTRQQTAAERAHITQARRLLATSIAEQLTDHLLAKWLELNDTIDGYPKRKIDS